MSARARKRIDSDVFVAGELTDADADGDGNLHLLGRDGGLGDFRSQPLTDVQSVGERRFGQDNGKFLAAEAGQDFAGTEHVAAPPTKLTQHFVPSEMTVFIVDCLEMIDVEHHDGNGPLHRRARLRSRSSISSKNRLLKAWVRPSVVIMR